MPQLDQLLRGKSEDPLFIAFALLVAAFLGAAHALTPGHGKTLVAAYLAGSRGRYADALYLGGVVTATHTASVFLLGLTTLWAAQFLPLNRVVPVLSIISGLLVTGLGAWLFWNRIHGRMLATEIEAGGHTHRGSLTSLGISGGLVPCPEALVVLLLAVSLGRIAFGLALLIAFTLGLALVLVAIGCAMVAAGPAIQKATGNSAALRILPILSAAVVVVLGLFTLYEAAKSLNA